MRDTAAVKLDYENSSNCECFRLSQMRVQYLTSASSQWQEILCLSSESSGHPGAFSLRLNKLIPSTTSIWVPDSVRCIHVRFTACMSENKT